MTTQLARRQKILYFVIEDISSRRI